MSQLDSLDTLWETFKFSPNKAQREAILHTDGPLYLPAGPGSGKTRVLLWRTVYLIACHDVEPESIFLATFTEKAAGQLREGIRALLGAVTNITGKPYDVERMYVGTVHSLCQRLISDRRFYPDHQAKHAPTLLDELSQYFRIYRKSRWESLLEGLAIGSDSPLAINTLFGKKAQSRHEAVTNCLSLFNRLSEECLDAPDWTDKIFDPALDETFRFLLTGYERYRAALEQHPARTDFSLLQQEALKVIQGYNGPPLFRHIIVDEYQDTNTIQERIFFALARETTNLCVVGDDDQAVFLLKNPESFIATFIGEVSSALADHIARKIEFLPGKDGGTTYDLEAFFPVTKQFTQRELRDAGSKSLYDQVQIDSDNEESFVNILRDESSLVFYFKFPAAFKVPLPRQIGNYNLDWGIARLNDAGMTLLYIRETKGSENIQDLQWAHEKRKIVCAQKYFEALNLDYRPIKGTNADWWRSDPAMKMLDGMA